MTSLTIKKKSTQDKDCVTQFIYFGNVVSSRPGGTIKMKPCLKMKLKQIIILPILWNHFKD